MNLQWVQEVNAEKILENYYNERSKLLMYVIDQSKLIKQQSIIHAKIAMIDAFNKTYIYE